MNSRTPSNESALLRALELLDSGQSEEEVRRQFPELSRELDELLDVQNRLRENARTLTPNPAVLEHALRNELPITNHEPTRYTRVGVGKGRTHLTLNPIHPMSNLWKIIIPVGVVVVVAVVLLSRPQTTPAPTPTPPGDVPVATDTPATPGTTEGATTPTPEAGSGQASGLAAADTLISEMLQDSSAESTTFAEETGDSNLIANDSQDLISFGQTYDAGSF